MQKALELKLDEVKEMEDDHRLRLKNLKERGRSLKSEEKNLGVERKGLLAQKEELVSVKALLEKKRSDYEEHLLGICQENDQSKVTDEEMLDKMPTEEEIKRLKEDVRLAKDSLIANMEYEKKLVVEKLDNDRCETLRKHELWKRELETKMQK
ncbi:hypothetical protein MLD38_025447 [Melastoma candidum]|uniref:Uncharacterized protein n=1 Tax=Melastoma candidum TaxID=119954 RepID=A0ACB9NV41_9MYRT|nr:hypothetical protein MLD38_025447 [Melastoma candidum]